ncbi:protein of unknown function [Xenorhabdus bovienii]|uniref:Uncharacterized protein n=1 Tax=Xenorhabdus bovienii TaxID=40576 RepID=A0A0B6XCA5_XENBV|nr:protein of unknown function [Xenorhabdus bovienii]
MICPAICLICSAFLPKTLLELVISEWLKALGLTISQMALSRLMITAMYLVGLMEGLFSAFEPANLMMMGASWDCI